MIYKIEMFSVYVWKFECCWSDGRWVGECSRLWGLQCWRLARRIWVLIAAEIGLGLTPIWRLWVG